MIFLVNIYVSCSTVNRRRVWEELCFLKNNSIKGEWCLMGDFNVVSSIRERKGRSANLKDRDMSDFNKFIADMDLIDPPLNGLKFTWFCSDGISTSRLDRF